MDLDKLYRDFIDLTNKQFKLGDFDAEHPIFIDLMKKQKMDLRLGVWLSFLYMAYYDEASAWATHLETDLFTVPGKVDYPIGMNRRNLFGGKILRHFESLVENSRRAKDWPIHNFTGDPEADWDVLKSNIGDVWGNGRFAIYTTAEMIQKVCNVPVTITGFDNKDSSGPADAIARLSGCSKDDVKALDIAGDNLYNRVVKTKLKPFYIGVDRGVVESVLCNFSGICRGRYYSGRNLDRQQERILRVETKHNVDLSILWDTRSEVFDHRYLGEYQGWDGIDKGRLVSYMQTGEVKWTFDER